MILSVGERDEEQDACLVSASPTGCLSAEKENTLREETEQLLAQAAKISIANAGQRHTEEGMASGIYTWA